MLDIIKYIIVPSNLIIILLIIALALLLSRRGRSVAIFLFAVGGLIYIFFGNGPVSYWLLGQLEYRYPALNSYEKIEQVDTIVILSGHALPDSYFPISSKVSSSTVFRLVEAIRLWRRISNSKIIISGHDNVPVIMKDFLISMGLPKEQIIIEDQANNTYENAINVKQKIGETPFVLVTSAGHMPRSMGVFNKIGMNPIPAPTDYMVGKDPMAADFLPTIQHLMYSDLAIHEYIGMLWYKLSGRL